MSLNQTLTALENTSVGTAVRESIWLFPTIETVHVLAIVLVVGSIMIVDLRLLNLASRRRPVSELLAEVLPWTWGAFACAAISGSLLFSSSALKYAHNTPFRLKMLLLLAAAINMAVFHLGVFRSVSQWDLGQKLPGRARLAGGISLALWVWVVACGRWIGFTT
ncbi:MAG TPA: DUF6644 family protein [Steroidobacteraceae bacterium]|nr:DUF6644 family protein [Steroidobacteraceae bacterium]